MDKYKDIFGKPNEGFHKTRLFGMAAFDMIGTILIAYGISAYTHKSFLIIFTVLFILA